MTATGTNAQREQDGWVRYGAEPHQLMHPATAAAVLALLWDRYPFIGGALVAEALTGARFSHRRAPSATAPDEPPDVAQ
jgi:hypothetical protein